MYRPKFSISDKLINNIKAVAVLTAELNHRHFPQIVLLDFENRANSLSVFASTSIEGNPLPLTMVKQLIKTQPQNLRNTEREVLNYNAILKKLNHDITTGRIDITVKLMCEIQKSVTTGLLEKYRCGKIRSEPVFVNNPKNGKPVYLPPDHQDVTRLLADLVAYLKKMRGKMDPLILAGVFHKQFVVIHPFIDGNGRTARLVTKTLLADMGINTFNLFSFENYYNQNVSKYFQSVGIFGNYYDLVDELDFTEWLEYFTDGILDELYRVKKELETETISPDSVMQSHHNKILEFIKTHGFITDKDYAQLTKRAKATRSIDFKKLTDLGQIVRLGKGKATYYKIKND
jgi:Fic family protein